jgi:transcription termination factor Rho
VAAQALEQSVLESKDKEQLLAIAKALGLKTSARSKKSDIIGQILETTGAGPASASGSSVAPAGAANGASRSVAEPATPETSAVEAATNGHGGSTSDAPGGEQVGDRPAEPGVVNGEAPASRGHGAAHVDVEADTVRLGPDGEPLAEWELDLPTDERAADAAGTADEDASDDDASDVGTSTPVPSDRVPGAPREPRRDQRGGQHQAQPAPRDDDDGDSRNSRRRRRRRKGKGGQDGPQGDDRDLLERDADAGPLPESVPVSGYVDLRDEGYGFVRVKGYLASREDAYVPVKLARQYGLRKGDHIAGLGRPAGRNEKNPALLEIHTVNGADPEVARRRPRFEDLTALFPDQRLRLEDASDPTNMTARIIDLVSPIGKGQRGLIVSPPKAGKTTVMKTIATAIEKHNPEVELIVLLIDERPEEVTDMRRTVSGEVISSTFDRPSDEHTHVAEMAIEKAKRMVEAGKDVVVILDGITRLSRAYNLAAPASGRILSGGIDAGALYPPKRFFGAARNVEEGGSLTILATALVETNSRMDEAIFEEFKGTGNMELRLDRRLAERRIYPAIDVDASSTRHEELLFDRKQLQMVWKLRRVLSGLAADGNAAPGLELLIDRLKTFRTNDEFLNEIAKQPSM